jgi:3-oxoacyl-[acyl-carrier protein] reductase
MDLRLRDKVFIVTGGGRGLGRATADLLVAEGARVVLSGRSQETLDDAVATLGDAAVGVVADNAVPGSEDLLVSVARDSYGRLDGALVSVGGPPKGSVTAIDDETWRASFESVFLGGLRVARAVVAALRTQGEGGSIAFVLSSSVRSPLADMAISNGLRPGLAMAAKTLADEVGSEGIRVNGLLPGRIGTDRLTELDAASGDPEAAKVRAVAGIPLGRYGEPEEFAAAAAFLLSPASSFITGTMLPVDGGMLRSL